jgi:glycosyltransferase involved in cell wall biosynthesis
MGDVLFVHNNFPAQFRFIAEALQAKGDQCVAIASKTGRNLPGIPVYRWEATRGSTKGIFPLATRTEADLIRANAAVEHALRLKKRNFNPDLIIGHPGWGETLLLNVVFPEAKQILHGEYYYRVTGGDVGFDPEFGLPSFENKCRAHAKNASMALALSEADHIVTPTPFQASVMPAAFQARTTIIHEGIDTERAKPIPDAKFTLEDGRVLDRSSPVITFVNRRFEPLRGYHIFMRALPKVLAAVPEARVLLIGADEAGGYGKEAPKGTTWKKLFLGEVERKLDMSRLHFPGRVGYERLLAAFSVSAAHVYYTYPFVLSWSLLEAMACECLVIGSDTAPVRDVVEHKVNGLLSDFFDVDALSDLLITACRDPQSFAPLRKAARQTVVERFDRSRICLPAWLRLIEEVRAGKRAA